MSDPPIGMAGCWTARQSVDAPRNGAQPGPLEELADQLLCYSDQQDADFDIRFFVSELGLLAEQSPICISFETPFGAVYLLEDAKGDQWVVCRRGSSTFLHPIEGSDDVGTLFNYCVIALTHIDLSRYRPICVH